MGNENLNEIESGLTIKDIFAIIKKHLLAILLFVSVATLGGFTYATIDSYVDPHYKATGSMLVSVDSTSLSSGGMNASSEYSLSQSLMATFKDFAKKDIVIDKVVSDLVDNYPEITNDAIKNNLTVTQSGQSLLVEFSFIANTPKDAADILNIIMEKIEEASCELEIPDQEMSETNQPIFKFLYKAIRTVESAKAEKAVRVNQILKLTLIALAAGVVLAFLYVFLYESFDTRFKTKHEVERIVGAPILSIIPYYTMDDLEKNQALQKTIEEEEEDE